MEWIFLNRAVIFFGETFAIFIGKWFKKTLSLRGHSAIFKKWP
jgi:CDP-diglyceride synthetase